jgi:hypothetical protein
MQNTSVTGLLSCAMLRPAQRLKGMTNNYRQLKTAVRHCAVAHAHTDKMHCNIYASNRTRIAMIQPRLAQYPLLKLQQQPRFCYVHSEVTVTRHTLQMPTAVCN